jgi:hypothetical protein
MEAASESTREADRTLEFEIATQPQHFARAEPAGAEAQAHHPVRFQPEFASEIGIDEGRSVAVDRGADTRCEPPGSHRRPAVLGTDSKCVISTLEHAESASGEFKGG